MTDEKRPPDELEMRIRALEAERLRPVPGPPVASKRAVTATERTAAGREAATVDAIRELIRAVNEAETNEEDQ